MPTIETGGQLIGQFALASALMCHGEQFDHDAAGLPFGQTLHEMVEGSPIGFTRKELVTVDEVHQRHGLLAQGVDDMAVVDDLVMLAGRRSPAARQRHEMRAADEHIEPIVVETHPEPMADQARGHGVEHLAQGEAASGCDACGDFLVIGGAAAGKRLQFGAFALDAFGIAGVHAADDLVDEAAIERQVVEIARAPQQQRILDRPFEMAVRSFDGTVLMGDAAIVAGGPHAVMGAKLLVATRQILARIPVQIAERGGQTVAAMLVRCSAEQPQGILQPLRQGHEALAAENDMGVLEAGIGEPEMIEPMVERLARDRDREISHVGEIRQAEPAGFMHLTEDDFLFLAM